VDLKDINAKDATVQDTGVKDGIELSTGTDFVSFI